MNPFLRAVEMRILREREEMLELPAPGLPTGNKPPGRIGSLEAYAVARREEDFERETRLKAAERLLSEGRTWAEIGQALNLDKNRLAATSRAVNRRAEKRARNSTRNTNHGDDNVGCKEGRSSARGGE